MRNPTRDVAAKRACLYLSCLIFLFPASPFPFTLSILGWEYGRPATMARPLRCFCSDSSLSRKSRWTQYSLKRDRRPSTMENNPLDRTHLYRIPQECWFQAQFPCVLRSYPKNQDTRLSTTVQADEKSPFGLSPRLPPMAAEIFCDWGRRQARHVCVQARRGDVRRVSGLPVCPYLFRQCNSHKHGGTCLGLRQGAEI